jgi:hypothetical protein
MTREEFIERLEEDKFFENPQEMIDYRLPVVQFYLSNYVNAVIQTPNTLINTKDVTIEYNKDTDFTLVNYAFNKIQEKFKKK